MEGLEPIHFAGFYILRLPVTYGLFFPGTQHPFNPGAGRFINDNAIFDFNQVVKDQIVIYVSGFVASPSLCLACTMW